MKYIYITGALIIIGAILDLLFVSTRKRQSEKMSALLEKGDYKTFDSTIDSFTNKYFLPKYNINFMKLTSAVRQDHYDDAKKLTDGFLKATLNKNETYSAFTMIFNYFVYRENQEYSSKALEKLRTVRNDENGNYIDSLEQIYRIYIEKSDKDLENLLKQNENVPDEYKYASDYLIAKIYENKKDKKKASQYRKAGDQHYALFLQKFRESYINDNH